MARDSRLRSSIILLALLPACGRSAPSFDASAPTVQSVLPLDGALGAPLDTSVSAIFSRRMDGPSISATTFTLKRGATGIAGAVTVSGTTATFVPAIPLVTQAIYVATITTGVSAGGVALATEYTWTFTAGPLAILATTPLASAAGVAVGKKPTVTFNNTMDPATITNLTFTLKAGASPVQGTVALAATSNTATFTPSAALGPGVLYTATITTGARDAGQTSLASDYSWTFRTGACSQATVVLGTAGTFAVLAYSTITNTGVGTLITGDLGLSPGSSITGAPTVTGAQHVDDSKAVNALVDLGTAYADAEGRTLCVTTVPAGNIGGQVFLPGLFRSATTMDITSADITLDAQGDADAVFLFQMGTTLTSSAGRKVLLTNGARATNVFWQVGTAPSLAAGTVFKGTILAHDAVSLGDGLTLDEGRALSLTTAVNLYNNKITTPLP